MFTSVARRLAILNAAVVVVIVLLLGSVTFFALRQQLNAEIDSSVESRLELTANQWSSGQITATGPGTNQDRSDEKDDEEVLSSGDTIVFIVDRSGQTLYNSRGLVIDGVPVQPGIERALAGKKDRRTVTIRGIGSVPVMSIPVRNRQGVVGAAQALRSLQEHSRELALLQGLTLAGLALGAVASVPAGLFLARRAMRPIRAAFDRQRTFVADASHELRTPLTLIRANAELVLDEPELRVAEIEPELKSILAEVDRTDRLVDDLLTLARADAGQLPLQREPHDLAGIAVTAAASMTAVADAKHLTIGVSGAPCGVSVDGERLLQVVRILIDNAIKHTPSGGSIKLVTSCRGREASLTVRDTGVGIPSAALERVFDRFYRVDKARTRARGGIGLGLPIAKAIVEAHGGRIRLSSRLSEGTVAEIILPAREGPVAGNGDAGASDSY